MERIPEPELMEDDEQARAYSEADFDAPHSMFVRLFVERFGDDVKGDVLDAGCGPADISVRFALACPECTVHGVDASDAMIRYGLERIRRHGLEERIRLYRGYLPGTEIDASCLSAIIVNSLLHHLPDPSRMWEIIRHYAAGEYRPPNGGCALFLMDLIRPETKDRARELVELYCGDEPEVLKRDFYHSLLAAYTPDEVKDQLSAAGLNNLNIDVVSDRHFVVWGEV